MQCSHIMLMMCMYLSQNPMAEITVQLPKVRKGSSQVQRQRLWLCSEIIMCSLWALQRYGPFHVGGRFVILSISLPYSPGIFHSTAQILTTLLWFLEEIIKEGSAQNCKYMCMNTNDTTSSFLHRQGNNEQCEEKYPRVRNNSSSQNG